MDAGPAALAALEELEQLEPTPTGPARLDKLAIVGVWAIKRERAEDARPPALYGNKAVLEAAQRVAAGIAGPDTLRLVARPEKVTGAGIEELGRLAPGWLDA